MRKLSSDQTETHGVGVRSYTLQLYGNPGKVKATLGNMLEYRAYLWDYVTRYYHKGEDATESTKGKGWIANQAFKRSRDLLKAGRNGSIATGEWFNCPKKLPLLCDGTLEESKESTWDYWIKVTNGPRLPAQTHRALKNALRCGGKLIKTCEIRQAKQGWLYARVFVEFEKPTLAKSHDYLGIDVGVNAGVARSDGYVGKSLRPILERTREKNAERRRQGHLHTLQSRQSACKQFLDREAKRIVTLAKHGNKIVVLESSKTLGNLTPSGSIGSWARQHVGCRVRDLAEVDGVTVLEVWPAYTSTTCEVCGYADKKNRRGVDFCCLRCGHVAHTDGLASRNLRRRATGAWPMWSGEKAGLQTRDSFLNASALGEGVS